MEYARALSRQLPNQMILAKLEDGSMAESHGEAQVWWLRRFVAQFAADAVEEQQCHTLTVEQWSALCQTHTPLFGGSCL